MFPTLEGQSWCPMCPGNAGWAMMFFWGLFWLVTIALVIWAVYRLAVGRRAPDERFRRDTAETLLRERYARRDRPGNHSKNAG